MNADEIRKVTNDEGGNPIDNFFFREIAAQLAEQNEINREMLAHCKHRDALLRPSVAAPNVEKIAEKLYEHDNPGKKWADANGTIKAADRKAVRDVLAAMEAVAAEELMEKPQ
jgi:hypothetical protein